ncbi:acyltransferase family protein [Uliginosibacterium gangwonense]|uniref:acyltransferase family protein n=1 Tax=Uliginosibacterium gangwonense TaxID=392736 RepID=UPI000367EFCF|nr:acyltransferase [Uliginosibacterium gangwonense]
MLKQRNKINALTSLRFFAAALVAFQHAGSTGAFKFGIHLFDTRTAVSFFFVLSGFILSHVYDRLDWRSGFGDFIAARVARLVPAHLATALLAMYMLGIPRTLEEMGIALLNLTMLQSWVPLTKWYYSLNAVSWSISTEMFFYFVFPFAIALANNKPRRLAVITIGIVLGSIAVATSLRLSPLEATPGVTAWGLLYISPLTRVAEFLIGLLAYRFAFKFHSRSVAWSMRRASSYEIAAVIFAFFTMVACTRLAETLDGVAPQASVWIRVAGPSAVFGLLIAIIYGERGAFSKILGWRPLVYLGEMSFALYLVHQLILRWIFSNFRPQAEAHWAFFYTFFWVVSLAGSACIFHFIERPIRLPLRALLETTCGNRKPTTSPRN